MRALAELRRELDELDGSSVDLVDVEKRVQSALNEVGRDLMVQAMKRADTSAAEVSVGGEHWGGRRLQRSTYVTKFGEVELERSVYQRSGRGPVLVPLEARLGIVEGRYTAGVARVLTRATALMTAAEAEGFLDEVGVAKVSVSTLHRVPRAIAARYEQRRAVIEPVVRLSDRVPDDAAVVQVALDGVMVPQDGEHARARGRKADEPDPPRHELRYGPLSPGPAANDDKPGRAWHEASVGTVSFWDTDGRHIRTIYAARMPEARKATLVAQLEAELTWVLAARPELDICFASDGAPSHWTSLEGMEQRLPAGTTGARRFVLDLFHALERLGEAAGLVDGEGTPASKVRLANWRETLCAFDDGAERLLKMLRYHRDREPKANSREKLQSIIDYLAEPTARDRTRYAEALRTHAPVGTGVTEAAAKTLVSVRMKRAGARFSQHGGQAVLLFRAALLSERFVMLSRALEDSYRVNVEEAA